MPKQAKRARKPSADTDDALSLLSADHRKVESLFEQYRSAATLSLKSDLAHKVCSELTVHTMLEEEIFYPACRAAGVEDAALDEAQVEHDAVKILVKELMTHRPRDEFYDAKVTVLSEYVKHHVEEEEKSGQGLFAKAGQANVDMGALGRRIRRRKAQLIAEIGKPGFRPSAVRSLGIGRQRSYYKERRMPGHRSRAAGRI